jgi:hypothetical protein
MANVWILTFLADGARSDEEDVVRQNLTKLLE